MAAAPSRLEELRRRVKSDPASVAFAALAEELRRAGQFDEAIATARAGLAKHPGYVSGHVTLGRSLVGAGKLDEARLELERVLGVAPDNLVALKTLGELHQLLAEPELALDYFRRAQALAPQDPDLSKRVGALEALVRPGAGRSTPPPLPGVRIPTPEPPVVPPAGDTAASAPEPAPVAARVETAPVQEPPNDVAPIQAVASLPEVPSAAVQDAFAVPPALDIAATSPSVPELSFADTAFGDDPEPVEVSPFVDLPLMAPPAPEPTALAGADADDASPTLDSVSPVADDGAAALRAHRARQVAALQKFLDAIEHRRTRQQPAAR